MIEYATKNETGRVLGFGEAAELPAPTEGRIAVALAAPKLEKGFPRGATTTCVLHIDDLGVLEWVETATLDELKISKTVEINEAKWKADQTSFVFAGKAIQADPHSMLQIQSTNGIILLTGSVPSAATRWKTLDNEYVDIPDKATWTQFYAAMVTQGSSNFDHAQSLKAQLSAATTPEAVANIKWA